MVGDLSGLNPSSPTYEPEDRDLHGLTLTIPKSVNITCELLLVLVLSPKDMDETQGRSHKGRDVPVALRNAMLMITSMRAPTRPLKARALN